MVGVGRETRTRTNKKVYQNLFKGLRKLVNLQAEPDIDVAFYFDSTILALKAVRSVKKNKQICNRTYLICLLVKFIFHMC